MAPNKTRGGLGGVDAFFQKTKPTSTSDAPSDQARTPRTKPIARTSRTIAHDVNKGASTSRASNNAAKKKTIKREAREIITIHVPVRQIAALEDLKIKERRKGKSKRQASLTAYVIEALDLLLAKHKK